jgi:hypothetical protein
MNIGFEITNSQEYVILFLSSSMNVIFDTFSFNPLFLLYCQSHYLANYHYFWLFENILLGMKH